MKIKFRILSHDEKEGSIIVRYFTDKVSEKELSDDPDETQDRPEICRTDCNLELDPSLDDPDEVRDYIVGHAPYEFLYKKSYPDSNKVDFKFLKWMYGEQQEREPKLEELKETRKREFWYTYVDEMQRNVTINGHTMSGDFWSQLMLTKIIASGEVPDGFKWKDVNNEMVEMTMRDLQFYAKKLMDRGYELFQHWQDKKQSVNDAQTHDKVRRIKW